VARCAIEPNFYVRDMLTWALTHLSSGITVPRLLVELRSDRAQARSQALHMLSKIKVSNVLVIVFNAIFEEVAVPNVVIRHVVLPPYLICPLHRPAAAVGV